jgi:transposase
MVWNGSATDSIQVLKRGRCRQRHKVGSRSVKQISTIGLDLAKNVFQIHGADAEGSPILNRKLRRAELLRFFEKLPPCLVGLEACGSSHYWAREIAALGHDVHLIPPIYVKPFGAPRRRALPVEEGSTQRLVD